MSQFVSEKSVFVNQNLESREALLRFVSDKAAEFGITDNADAVYDAFMAREAMGETGMTDGFAVPHAKSDDIKDQVRRHQGRGRHRGQERHPARVAEL